MDHAVLKQEIRDLAADLVAVAASRSVLVGVAESCTGGLLAGAITEIPGSSSVFAGGIVAYANAVKERLLNVPGETIAVHGAVSEPVARAMARGLIERLSVDWAAAVTGIAGPTGGTPEKPVGLVYLAVAGAAVVPAERPCRVHRRVFSGDRRGIRLQAVRDALRLLVSAVGASGGE